MTKRILIVDDVEYNLEFEENIIKSFSDELDVEVSIDTAGTVLEALRKIHLNTHYDAMIVDMNLPDGSGTLIAKSAHVKSKNTRIAALTIYPDEFEAERAHFDLFLKKPIMPENYKMNLMRLLQI
jgi:CheY-like chemotaxis protein